MNPLPISLLIILLALPASAMAEDVATEVFGGPELFEVFKSAPKVTASRLAKPHTATNDHPRDLFDPLKYRVMETVSVPADTAQKLRTILANPDSYRFDVSVNCAPVYGVRLMFETDKSTVVLDLCLQCSILSVTRDGRRVKGGGLFGPASPSIIAIAKALFPKDKELQAFTK